MIGLLSIIAVGFFLGMRHATDPDHVIAVTTIVTRQRSIMRAAVTGAFWGIGHTLTIFVVGSAIILFDVVIPARIGLSMELSAGLMLVLLGILNLASLLPSMPETSAEGSEELPSVHSQAHSHGDYVHSHPYGHCPGSHPHPPDRTPLAWLDRVFGRIGLYQHLRPLVVGIVHGLAGSAAVALLVLTTIRNSYWGIAYLLLFGVGTIVGMMLITMSIASTLHFLGNRHRRFSRRLSMVSGLLSLAFGLVLAYQICVINGLFASRPHWVPK